jgi:endonuclease YncB( thermonuclease family)
MERRYNQMARWLGKFWRIILLGLALVAATLVDRSIRAPSIDRVEGHPRLVDGDSFYIDGREVRMVGIDAPEGRQKCQRGGKSWSCGEAARRTLQGLIAGRSIVCHVESRDQHGRLLTRCEVAGTDLNARMVELGFAVGFGDYRREEQSAKQAKRGLWSGQFERPQDWRRKNLGSAS